jgi:hypothetical protein
MLFKILKLFGLDVPAEIDAVKARIDRRVELATVQVKQAARNAALMAALAVFAAMTGAMALGVGALAAYRWVAENYGAYAGFAVVGGTLAIVTVILGVAAVGTARSFAPPSRLSPPQPTMVAPEMASADVIAAVSAAEAAPLYQAAVPIPPPVSANDLVVPLTMLLSRYVKYPTLGHPLFDELLGHLKTSARGTADEAIGSATNVIRRGDRGSVLLVLAGAAFGGWLLTRHHSDTAL